MDDKKALGLLGIAMRAGQVISGDDMAEREIRAGKAALILLDATASGRTQDKYRALGEGKGIPLFLLGEDSLGKAIGKDGRMVAVVKKGPLSKQLRSLLETAARPS